MKKKLIIRKKIKIKKKKNKITLKIVILMFKKTKIKK
jgi:hypothetical protein